VAGVLTSADTLLVKSLPAGHVEIAVIVLPRLARLRQPPTSSSPSTWSHPVCAPTCRALPQLS
jgi:hypothetical protein